MSSMQQVREKHDGEWAGRTSLRLWLRLLTCTTIMEKRIRRRLSDRYEATLPRFDVLAALERNPDGMTMGALSRALLVSNGNMTGVVQALSRDKLVGIEPSPTDGRASIVRLTSKGKDYFGGLAIAHHEWVEGMLAGMGLVDREALYVLLGALKDSLAMDVGEEIR